ncbi:MAG: hypothetical protein ACR2L2_16275 [Acidobacteriota bacterium]
MAAEGSVASTYSAGWFRRRPDGLTQRWTEAYSYAGGVAESNQPIDRSVLENIAQKMAQLESAQTVQLRQAPAVALTASHAALDAGAIDDALLRLFDWLTTEAFAMLHPIEQHTVALLRLYEIFPFEKLNGPVIHAFCGYYLVRSGYPFPLYSPNRRLFLEALDQGFTLATQPLAALTAASISRALDRAAENR